jgi:hypothetical protein
MHPISSKKMNIPCSVASDTLTLYKFVPFTYPLYGNPTLPPVQPEDIVSLQDLANSNHFPATSAIYFKSDAKSQYCLLQANYAS